MTPTQLALVRDAFRAVCDAPLEDRNRALDLHCRGDAAVRARVAALLDLDSAAGTRDAFLATPALADAGAAAHGDAPAALVGEMVAGGANYRIIRLLGEGGMGLVYEARQSSPSRRVALKLMRQVLRSAEAEGRFVRECELLGRLNHPGIASIYEAGQGRFQLTDGQTLVTPYLAMEYVEGATLIAHCAQAQLGVAARLELIARVCDAVHHAHEKGVIHRDLKPGNILVNDGGEPKVLDFGIARLIDGSAPQDAALTRSGQMIGTPAYMSPEQVGGNWQEIDTRTDIYAIGVMLYQLLAGRPPLDLHDTPLAEAARRIVEDEPAPLERIVPALRGDLAAITAKALQKNRARRYASAAAVAEDIRRHLRREPILARPPTPTYIIGRFVRRHRVVVASVALALVGGFAGLTFGMLEARAQRDAARAAESRAITAGEGEKSARLSAQREARIAAAVNEFWNQDVLESVSPDNTPDRDILMRDVLSAAAAKIEGKFGDEPLVEAAVRATLGKTYLRMGEHADAQTHLARALTLRSQHLASTDTELFETLGIVANLRYQQGHYAEAARQVAELLELSRRAYGDEHPLTLSFLGSLGLMRLQLRQFAEAQPLLAEAVERARRAPPNPIDFSRMLVNLAMCYMRTGRFGQAEAPLREAVDIARAAGGEDHPDTLNALGVLAAMHNEKHEFDKAIPLLLRVAESQLRVLGEEHSQTLMTQANLGFALLMSERLEEADTVIARVVRTRERVLGEGHPHTLASLYNFAVLREKQGRLAEAEATLIRGIDLRRATQVDSHPPLDTWNEKLRQVRNARGSSAGDGRAPQPEARDPD